MFLLQADTAAGGGFTTFYLFSTVMAVGIAIGMPWIPPKEMGRKFFILMSLLAVLFYALAILASERGLDYFHLGACGALIFYNVFISPKGGVISSVLLWIAIALGIAGLWSDSHNFGHQLPIEGHQATWLFLNYLASALVLGGSLVAMILGHWYLVSPGLSFGILKRVTVLFILGLTLRILAIGISAYFQGVHWENIWVRAGGAVGFFTGSGLFISVRLLFGIVLPVAMAYMAFECVRIRSNQSATGILYVIVAFVLVGEVIAKNLLISQQLLL